MRDVVVASELLKPYDAQRMRCYCVSVRINRVANDDAECSAPVELMQVQNRLKLPLTAICCQGVQVVPYALRLVFHRLVRHVAHTIQRGPRVRIKRCE